MLKRLPSSIKSLFARYPTAEARINFLFLVLGLACVLAIGPFLQTYSFSLLTSQEASIYSTAYSTNVVKQPQLSEWLTGIWWPQFLVIAVIIALSFRMESFRAAFIRTSGCAFTALTVFDLVLLSINGDLLSIEAFQCVVANLAGGPIVAAILLGMVSLAEALTVLMREHKIMRLTLIPMTPVLCGLALLFLSYYLISLFYNPTTSKFVLRASPSFAASYAEKKTANGPERKTASSVSDAEFLDGESFQVFGKQVQLSKMLLWDGKAENLEVNWRNESGSKYDLYIQAFDGCSSEADREALRGLSGLKFEEVGQIAISGEDGLASIRVDAKDEGGYFKMTQDSVGMFGVLNDGEGEGNKNLRIHSFVDANAQLTYWNPTGDLNLAFTNLLIDHNDYGQGYPAKRSIALFVDGKRFQFKFEPDQSVKWGDEIVCRLIKLQNDSNDFSIKSQVYVGLYMSLVPRDKTIRTALSRRDVDQVRVKGLNGWVIAQAVLPDEVDGFFTPGEVGFMSVRAVEALNVNGEQISVAHQESVQVSDGEIFSRVEEGGLVVQGRAAAIYKSGVRVNRTRWERLDWPARAIIFAGVPALFTWLSSMLIMALKANRSIGGILVRRPS